MLKPDNFYNIGHLNKRSSTLAPTSCKLTKQVIVMQHMNAHINGILKAKSAIDTSCPKTWMTNTKVQDQRKREGQQLNSSKKSSRSNSIISAEEQYKRKCSQSAVSTDRSSYDPMSYGIQKSKMELDKSNQNPTDLENGGDLLDVHSNYFKKSKDPFSPRLLKTNAVSTLRSNPNIYNPLKRSSKPKQFADDKERKNKASLKKTKEDDYNLQIQNHDDDIKPVHNDLEESKFSANFIEHPISDSVAENVLSSTARKIRDAEEEMMCLNFISEVTSDILSRNIFTNRVFQQVLEYHIQRNKGTLKYEQMRRAAQKIRDELGIPENNEDLQNTYGYASTREYAFDEVDGDKDKLSASDKTKNSNELSFYKSNGNFNGPTNNGLMLNSEFNMVEHFNESSVQLNDEQPITPQKLSDIQSQPTQKSYELQSEKHSTTVLVKSCEIDEKTSEPILEKLNSENKLPPLFKQEEKINEPIKAQRKLPSLNKSNKKINDSIVHEVSNEPLLTPQKVNDIHLQSKQEASEIHQHLDSDSTTNLGNHKTDPSYLQVGISRLLTDLDNSKNQEDPYIEDSLKNKTHKPTAQPRQNTSQHLDTSDTDDMMDYEDVLQKTLDGKDMHSPKAEDYGNGHSGLDTLRPGEFERYLKRSVHFNPKTIIHEEEEDVMNGTYDLGTMKQSIEEVNDDSKTLNTTYDFEEGQDGDEDF